MNYNGTIYRPPVEANTLLLPVTEGCSHNGCSFCNMYKDVSFRMLTLDEIEDWLTEMQNVYGSSLHLVKRIYLVGADPFVLSANALLERFDVIRAFLPNVEVISMYATVRNIMAKSDEDLQRLKAGGLNDLYVGVEAAFDDVLVNINKGHTVEDARIQLERLNRIGIGHRDLYMLGTAGKGRGVESGRAIGAFINETAPNMILINTMSPFPGTDLEQAIRDGRFVPAGETEVLQEERAVLESIDLPDMYFWAAHGMDAVRISGTIKDNKEEMLGTLDHAIATMNDDTYTNAYRRYGV